MTSLFFALPADAAVQRADEPDAPTTEAEAFSDADSLSEGAEPPCDADPSPAAAGLLSLVTTAGPFAVGSLLGDEFGLGLIGASLLFGPLSGYAYGDVMDRGVKGLGFRSAVAAGGTLAIFALCQAGECNPFRDNPPRGEDVSTVTLGVVIVGGLVLVGSAAIDVLAAPGHVTKANRARAEARGQEASAGPGAPSGTGLSVYPLVSAGREDTGFGVAASLRF